MASNAMYRWRAWSCSIVAHQSEFALASRQKDRRTKARIVMEQAELLLHGTT